MPVVVTIIDADVYYRPNAGRHSANHDFFNNPIPPVPPAHWGNHVTGPIIAFDLSQKHGLIGSAALWLTLSDNDFVRFKNGGKRMPSGAPAGNPTKTVGVWASSRDRWDRTTDPIEEGDVGPYKKGDGNLYKAKLAPATSARPAA